MSYAGSITAQLLRSAIAGKTGYDEGQIAGGQALAKANEQAIKDRREAMLATAKAAADNRTSTLIDPNDPTVLAGKKDALVAEHRTNRLFDVQNPLHDPNGASTHDKAFYRMRSAYKAKLMAPSRSRTGIPRPGMDEASAEELTSQAWGAPENTGTAGPDLSTRGLMSGSILRGGGAAATSTSSTSSAGGVPRAPHGTSSSKAVANDPRLNATMAGGKTKPGNINLGAAAPASSAPPGVTPSAERDMDPADLWDKKTGEGMTPDQATAYVHKVKGM